MKSTSLVMAITGLALLAPGIASAQVAPAELYVRGTITPDACVSTAAGGGAVGLGIVNTERLDAALATAVATKSLAFTINCPAPTLVAFSATDNREGSSLYSQNMYFGLGLNLGAEKIGSTSVRFSSLLVDGVTGQLIVSNNSGGTWYRPTLQRLYKGMYVGFNAIASGDSNVPLSTVSGQIEFLSSIAPADTLTTSAEIAIDGSITMEMLYL